MSITISPGLRLPDKSRADRNIARQSKGHFTVHAVLGRDNGRHFQAESWLEFCLLLLLNADRRVTDFREQVRFRYGAELEYSHVFDAVATMTTGERIAYTVKPTARLASGRFLDQMQEITWWVEDKKFAKEVRLFTEEDIDPVLLANARIMAAVREPDPEADAITARVVQRLVGAETLRNLTISTGIDVRGYRALLRMVRDGPLRLVQNERITPQSLVHVDGER